MLYTQKFGLKISKLALGTWAMGAGKDWGPADKNDCINAIHTAIAKGVNLIDTAPIYGNYHAEELLGQALIGKRDKVLLCTKCGLTPGERAVRFDLSPQAVRTEIEASLKRLNTDYIDIYLIHWPDRNTPFEQTISEFEKLKKEGKIRFYGACNLTPIQLKEISCCGDISFFQNEYSLLNQQKSAEVLDFCLENKKIFMAYGVLGGGILSGKYKKPPCLARSSVKSFFYKFYKDTAFEKSQKAVKLLKDIADKYKATPAQAALNFALATQGIDCALFGARNAAQVEQNTNAASWQFTKEDLDYINEKYA